MSIEESAQRGLQSRTMQRGGAASGPEALLNREPPTSVNRTRAQVKRDWTLSISRWLAFIWSVEPVDGSLNDDTLICSVSLMACGARADCRVGQSFPARRA